MPFSRRDFLTSTLAGSVAFGLSTNSSAQESAENKNTTKRAAKLPIIICAANGFNYLDLAYAFLAGGGDTLDAALKVVQGPENDPNDESSGLGGHPNEEGVVELDACCMHGPTRTAGSVGGVRNIKMFPCCQTLCGVIPDTSCWWEKAPNGSRWLKDSSAKIFLPRSPAKNGCSGKKRILTGGGPVSTIRTGGSDFRSRLMPMNGTNAFNAWNKSRQTSAFLPSCA
jgi:hypothetical protein